MYSLRDFVMIDGSSQATAASSSHRKPGMAYLAIYCAPGVELLRTASMMDLSMLVLTEMSTVVTTTRGHLPWSTALEASGSIHRLNSCMGESANSGSSVRGLMLPPMMMRSLESCGNSGSIAMANARLVIGPAA